jgi:Lon protease-like protein
MLPSQIPIFPLPTVVLFPEVSLPLHIFEPRYREMVTDALATDRLIGMVLLRPGWEPEYEGHPPIYGIGCVGVISHHERLPDGRYNIVLQGVDRVRITGETHERAYRRAYIEPLGDPLAQADRRTLRDLRHRLEALVAPFAEPSGAELKIPASVPDGELVNALAQYLPLEPVEKQALLERDGAVARCEALIELLEMKAILQKCSTPRFGH